MRRLLASVLALVFAPVIAGCSSASGSVLTDQERTAWEMEFNTFGQWQRDQICRSWHKDVPVDRFYFYTDPLSIPRWKTTAMLNHTCP